MAVAMAPTPMSEKENRPSEPFASRPPCSNASAPKPTWPVSPIASSRNPSRSLRSNGSEWGRAVINATSP